MAYVSAYCCHYTLLTKFVNFIHGYSKHPKIIVDKIAKRKKAKTHDFISVKVKEKVSFDFCCL